ncbi:hypothetical protein [Streptomyces sp. NPDC056512]|uniref:hypothetical protein n=1 Tax=Streptomyces sp. NPDC056512 TaxID=3345846 RepID=UPI0036B10228
MASEHTDPRVTRTIAALREAVVELARQRPVSQITVAELAGHAGVTRATFCNCRRTWFCGPGKIFVKRGCATVRR